MTATVHHLFPDLDAEHVVRAAVPQVPVSTPKPTFPATPRLVRAIDFAKSRAMANRRDVNISDIWFVLLCDPHSDGVQTLIHMGISPRVLLETLAPPHVPARSPLAHD